MVRVWIDALFLDPLQTFIMTSYNIFSSIIAEAYSDNKLRIYLNTPTQLQVSNACSYYLYFFIFSYNVDELPMYVDRLHKYNEIKDVAQSVIGRIGKYIVVREFDKKNEFSRILESGEYVLKLLRSEFSKAQTFAKKAKIAKNS